MNTLWRLDGRVPNKTTYGKNNLVLFIIHVLFVLNVIGIISVHDKRLRRNRKRNPQRNTKSLSSFTFKFDNQNCPTLGCRIFFLVHLIISGLKPSLILFFLTPFPYIALWLCVITGKARFWNICMTTWIVTCSVSIILSTVLAIGLVGHLWIMALWFIPLYVFLVIFASVYIRYLLITDR